MESVTQYLKDRIESFNDYYPCIKEENCNLFHVYNWIQFFVVMYNDTIVNNNDDFLLQEVNIVLNLLTSSMTFTTGIVTALTREVTIKGSISNTNKSHRCLFPRMVVAGSYTLMLQSLPFPICLGFG